MENINPLVSFPFLIPSSLSQKRFLICSRKEAEAPPISDLFQVSISDLFQVRWRLSGSFTKTISDFRFHTCYCDFLEAEEAELLLATCITRTLPPALTLESGLEQIKDVVEELKSKPCYAKSGMHRFQICNLLLLFTAMCDM